MSCEADEATLDLMARAFNDWMRRYIENPELFAREFETVGRFLAEDEDGEPDYGRRSAAYLLERMIDLDEEEDEEEDRPAQVGNPPPVIIQVGNRPGGRFAAIALTLLLGGLAGAATAAGIAEWTGLL